MNSAESIKQLLVTLVIRTSSKCLQLEFETAANNVANLKQRILHDVLCATCIAWGRLYTAQALPLASDDERDKEEKMADLILREEELLLLSCIAIAAVVPTPPWNASYGRYFIHTQHLYIYRLIQYIYTCHF